MNENGRGSQKFLLRGVNIPKFRRGGNGTLTSIINSDLITVKLSIFLRY